MSKSPEFVDAVQQGEVARAAALLATDPTLLGDRAPDGVSAVRHAVYRGHRRMVDWLRARGAHLDLFDAAAVGDVELVSALVAKAGSDVNATASDGWTPLHLAAFFGHSEAAGKVDPCRSRPQQGVDE